jgi:hypothetical protein
VGADGFEEVCAGWGDFYDEEVCSGLDGGLVSMEDIKMDAGGETLPGHLDLSLGVWIGWCGISCQERPL